VQAAMPYVLPIVALLVASAVAALAPAVRADEVDCDEIGLRIALDEFLPTWCYSQTMAEGDARAQVEATFVEAAESYALVVSAEAYARSYLPRLALEPLIGSMLEDEKLAWREGVRVDGFTARRFAIIENSGRETNCVGFSENTASPSGQPRKRLYGYLCNAESGEIADTKLIGFIAAIDG
jgi:hypothetical protein